MNPLADLLKTSGLTGGHDDPMEPNNGRLFLHAGQLYVSANPVEITTVLGSCVAICICDPVAGVGGMNHFMLSRELGPSTSSPRYARYATTMLLQQLRDAGAEPRRMKAKIFGGARILSQNSDDEHDLGGQNVRAARELLQDHGIPIVDQQTGGSEGRKLVYQTATGETAVTKVRHAVR